MEPQSQEVRMDGLAPAPYLTRYAALAIDVPNICTTGSKLEGTLKRIPFEELDWRALLELMRESVGAERCEYLGGAYLTLKGEVARRPAPQQIREAILDIFGEGRKRAQVIGGERDIDSLIVCDLFPNILELCSMQHHGSRVSPYEVTILLASGDHIYAHALKRISRTFGELLRVTLHTFAWRDHLSASLATMSDKIFYLDDIPGLVPARK